uniref:Uncharacterized protein n=1 Tax=Meloidogyne enterolobii TaxID=390850 RepID=A0A6V7W096_MELEN|nr:unnamed protein product [Meloidogyne enterolobii]
MSNYKNYSKTTLIKYNNKNNYSFCNYNDYLSKAWGLKAISPFINQGYNLQNEKEKEPLTNPKKIKNIYIDRNKHEWHFQQFVGFQSDIYKPLIKRKYGMVQDGKSSENINFRCTQSRKLSCRVRGKLVKSDGNLFTRCEHNHPIDDLLEENQDNSIDVVEEGGNSENILSTSLINKKEKSRQNELINYLFPHCIETKINKNKWLRIEQEEEENYFKQKEGQFYIDKEGNKWNFVKNIKNEKDLDFIIKQNFLKIWDEKSGKISFCCRYTFNCLCPFRAILLKDNGSLFTRFDHNHAIHETIFC